MTLVEMIVVLAIIGVSVGAVVLSLGAFDRDTGVQSEANRLADRLRLAADEVLVSNRPISVQWGTRGYGFVGAGLGEALVEQHALSDGVRLSGPEGRSVAAIDPDGAEPPLTFVLAKNGKAWSVTFDGLNAQAAAMTEVPS